VSSTPASASPRECAVVVPVYRNAANVPELVARLDALDAAVPGGIEAVCVVDGSPDDSHALLAEALAAQRFPSTLLLLSRNFGAFAAIREGLRAARGTRFAVMAADLQEPAELIEEFFAALATGECDLTLGTRAGRDDPLLDRAASAVFWGVYRRLVQPDLPPGGVDVFGCNAAFRAHLLEFGESHSSLVGQLLWLGFRRKLIPYARQPRRVGKSAWTFRRKLTYLMDSLFSFSDLPIRAFVALGTLGLAASALFALVVAVARLAGAVTVPGYAATVITILFFAGLNLFGLGIIGSYVWRAYENTKARPLAVVMHRQRFDPTVTE
jgi:glycosyltransferase involved in cell wall biosynthesis